MNNRDLDRMIAEAEGRVGVTYPALVRKVYVWMTMALAITGITAYGVATSPNLLQMIFSSQLTFFGIIIAELAFVFLLIGRLNKMSLTTATLCFIAYSVLNGVTMASIFLLYTMSSIASTFFITAGTFGVMSLIGYTTRADLTSMGKLLIMALIGIIIATIVNIFIGSSTMDLIISYAGVLIFVGLTAYDTQKIKFMLAQCTDMGEGAQKLSLIGALTLYLDFINLFIYLLRILGARRD